MAVFTQEVDVGDMAAVPTVDVAWCLGKRTGREAYCEGKSDSGPLFSSSQLCRPWKGSRSQGPHIILRGGRRHKGQDQGAPGAEGGSLPWSLRFRENRKVCRAQGGLALWGWGRGSHGVGRPERFLHHICRAL